MLNFDKMYRKGHGSVVSFGYKIDWSEVEIYFR